MGTTLKILIASVLLNIVFGLTAWGMRSELNLARLNAEVVIDANVQLEKAIDAQKAICLIADQKGAEYQQERKEFEQGTDEILTKLDEIKTLNEVKDAGQTKKGTSSLPLNTDLPADVVSLLEQACSRVSGSSCGNARPSAN